MSARTQKRSIVNTIGGISIQGAPSLATPFLQYDSVNDIFIWVAGTGAFFALGSLTDVTLTAPVDGDSILFDTVGSLWKNQAMSGDITQTKAGVTAIGALKVLTSMINALAVTTPKIAALAVTNAKLAADIVAAKIIDFNTAVRTNRLDQMAAPTADVSMNTNKITSLVDPTAAQEAATKNYVDSQGGGNTFARVVVKADQSVASSTTFVDATELVVALTANKNYAFQLYLFYQAGAAGDFKYTFTLPTGATGLLVNGKWDASAPTGTQSITVSKSVISSSFPEYIMISAHVIMGGTAGNLQMQFAQVISDATAAIVKEGACLVVQEEI